MKKIYLPLIFILLLFSSCSKTEIKQIELRGTIKAQVYVCDEFGYNLFDFKDINFVLDDGKTKLTTTADSKGECLLDKIPTGTYNLIISKEGFYDYQLQGVQIVGGDEPIHLFIYLVGKTRTSIENISLELDEFKNINLKGTVNYDTLKGSYLIIRYFIHNQETVSYFNYMDSGEEIYVDSNNFQINSKIYANTEIYPSGSKIYVIAYGSPVMSFGYYDIVSNLTIWPVGKPSNIASITIP
jgi:hypothetical protein